MMSITTSTGDSSSSSYSSSEFKDLLTLKELEPGVTVKRGRFDENKEHIVSLYLEWNNKTKNHHDGVCATSNTAAEEDDDEMAACEEYFDIQRNYIEVYYIDRRLTTKKNAQNKEKNGVADEQTYYVAKLQDVLGGFHQLKSLHLSRYPFRLVPWDGGGEEEGGLGTTRRDVATALQSLEIQQCGQLADLSFSSSKSLARSLKVLVIQMCDNLRQLDSIGQLKNLNMLQILECSALETLPTDLGNLESLEFLQIKHNHALREIPPSIGKLQNLKRLELYGMPLVTKLPPEIAQLKQLEMLNLISLPSLETIPVGPLEILPLPTSLYHLEISCCPRLRNLQNSEIRSLNRLKNVRLSYMDRLETVPRDLKRLSNLERIELSGLEPSVVLEFFCSLTSPRAEQREETAVSFCPNTIVCRGLYHRDINRRLGEVCTSLIPALPRSLTCLDLENQGICSLDGFLSVDTNSLSSSGTRRFLLPQPALPRGIRRLSLHNNPILKSTREHDRKCLLQLLQEYPQLGWIGWDLHLHHHLHQQYHASKRRKGYNKGGFHVPLKQTRNDPSYKLFTASTTHLLLLNRCGRVLLGPEDPNHQSIPLSVWPIVLAQVRHNLYYKKKKKVAASSHSNITTRDTDTRECTIMECSVLYSLLQGPAFLSRPRV